MVGTPGGTIAASNNGGSDLVPDGARPRDGQITTDLKDRASMLEFTSNGGTLDGTSAPVVIAAGGQVVVAPGETLTAKGSIVNHGTISLDGDPNAGDAVLAIAGTVTLSGGGKVTMTDGSGNQTDTSQIITGTVAADTLNNVDNLISGYGQLGAGTMTLANQAKGTIEALVGTITVDTGARTVTNAGLMEGVGATLLLRGVVNGTTGGTVAALDAVGISGLVLLDGATLRGGTIATDLKDTNSALQLTSNGGTLDGTAGAVTLAAGAQAMVGAAETLMVMGAIVNHGSLSVTGNLFSGTATLLVNGTVTLSGAGTVSLSDASGYANATPQVITGSSSSAVLENVDNLISGYGELGNGTLTLSNDAKATIEAIGGTLTVGTGNVAVSNAGLLEAVGGTLDLPGDLTGGVTNRGTIAAGNGGFVIIGAAVANAGVVSAQNGGTLTVNGVLSGAGTLTAADGGVVLLDGASVSGGRVVNSAFGQIDITTNGATLAGEAIANAGTIALTGNGYTGAATLLVNGTVTLAGGGVLALSDSSGFANPATQVIKGSAASNTLDNAGNVISGYGALGAGELTLINEVKGTVQAMGGALTVDTGAVAVSNAGVLEAVNGDLILRGVVDGTKGGTIAALNNGGGSGTVLLDGATLRGGTIATDLKDTASTLTMTANGGTLDGTSASVTIAPGARVVVNATNTLTLKGAIADQGTIYVSGDLYGGNASVALAGTMTVAAGGQVSFADVSGSGSASTQRLTGSSAAATLDDVGGLISGYGQLGGGTLTLINEAKGTIEATGGTLTVDTGATIVTNAGLTEAINGTLELVSGASNSGTISAGASGALIIDSSVVNSGSLTAASGGTLTVKGSVSGASGRVAVAGGGLAVLDGATLSGGTLSTAAAGIVDVTLNGVTLAGVTVANAGTVSVTGNEYGGTAAVTVTGTVTMSGGGVVALTDSSGAASATTQVITGSAASDTLANVDNLISGYGQLGNGTLTLLNEAKGTIEAAGGAMTVNTGTAAMGNAGLLEAIGGTLELVGAGNNSGTITAGNGGAVIIDGAVANSGTASVLNGGTLTVRGTVSGAGTVTVANGGSLLLDAGVLSGGKLANSASGNVVITTNGATIATLAIANAGSIDLTGNLYGGAAIATISGTVALGGGGVVALADSSGNASAATQVIKGSIASDTLDNVDNLITGYGSLGAGTLTLINETKATIQATGGTLTIDPGTVATSNRGLIEAVNGELILRGTVDGTKGGTVAALNSGRGSGTVLLDGATLRGGTIVTDLKDLASILTMTANGGTLDGASIAAGAQVLVNATNTLTIRGLVADQGTIDVSGNLFGGTASLAIAGTLAVAATGLISLADVSTSASPLTQIISGSSAAATLDNSGLISGYGQIGGGTLTLINEASGTIDAAGGTLIVNTGTTAAINRGLIEMAAGGALALSTNVNNASGTIAAGDGTIAIGAITVSGGVLSSSTKGEFQITGNATLDGSAVPLTLAAGANLLISGGTSLTVTGTVDNAGVLTNTGKLIDAGTLVNTNTVTGDVTLSGSGGLINQLGAVVTGAVTATGSGQTVANLGMIDGLVTLPGGDRLAIGVASVFGGGLIVNGVNNTLEIASGPYALSNFDAPGTPQYSTLQIDAGVSLTVDGSDLLTGVTLVNLGTLTLTGFQASAPVQNAGQFTGDITLASGIALVNAAGGTISGNGLAAVLATNGPVSVTNSGVIDPALYGVDLAAGGTVVNAAGGVIDGNIAGVIISGGQGTVTNGGTVSGGGVDAVSLAAGFANRVILTPGAAFVGLVDGGNPIGGTVASVLEFGASPGATRISGLGTAFVDFSTVTIDAGAAAVLGGSNTLASGAMFSDAGSLIIAAGGILSEADPGVVSSTTGATAIVDGAGSFWNANRGLVAGDTGVGAITVSNHASLTATASGSFPALALGASAGGNGALAVFAAQARLVGQLNVGQAGGGTVTVSSQGTLSTGNDPALDPAEGIDVATASGASGQVTVSGSKSLLTNTGRFVVGDAGEGALSILSGGSVSTGPGTQLGLAGLVIANTASASGSSVTLSGAGSTLSVGGLLDVGLAGSGVLALSGGAMASAGSLDAGSFVGSVGQIDLSGSGTKLSVTGTASIADNGAGVLSVLNGATFSGASLTIGSQPGGSGALIVSGTGSAINLTGALNIGSASGIGALTVGPGAAIHAAVVNLRGAVVLDGGLLDPTVMLIQGQTIGPVGTVAGDDIVDEGVIQAGTQSAGLLIVQGTVLGGGTLTVNGTVQNATSAGILQINAGGTMELTGAVLNTATTTFSDDMANTYTVNNSVVDVTFADGAGVLLLDDIAGFGGTITSSHHGDRFVIAGGVLSNLGVSNGNTLTMTDGGVNAGAGGTDRIVFGSAIDVTGFKIVNGDTVQVACFASGTLIETTHGPVAVESLTVGDELLTLSGGIGRIVWIGSRTVDCERHPRPETVWPISIEPGAFAENVPSRALVVSPDHGIYHNGVLIPAKLLVNGSTVRQTPVALVVYHHVELQRHDIILAEGLPAETYLDVGDRGTFSGGKVTAPHPDFSARRWEMAGCAPIVLTGATLAATKSVLAERAKKLASDARARSLKVDPTLSVNRPLEQIASERDWVILNQPRSETMKSRMSRPRSSSRTPGGVTAARSPDAVSIPPFITYSDNGSASV